VLQREANLHAIAGVTGLR